MNILKKIIPVILFSLILFAGMFYLPSINADNVNEIIVIDDNTPQLAVTSQVNAEVVASADTVLEICPTVCVPMWVIASKDSCEFIECGSGCGVDDVKSFQTEIECKKGIENLINPPVVIDEPTKIKLNVRFSPKVTENSGYIYENSIIHTGVVSSKPLLKNEYTLVFKLTSLVDVASSNKVVYLKINQNNVVEVPTEIDASTVKAEVYNQVVVSEVKEVEQFQSAQNVNVSANVSKKTSMEKAIVNRANLPNNGINRVYIYNYQVSIKKNLSEIEAVFGKEYKDYKYSLEVYLVENRIADSQDPDNVAISEKFTLAFAPIDSIPIEIQEQLKVRTIAQSQVRVSNVSVNADARKDLEKSKGANVNIEVLNDSQVYTDQDVTEMYVSNQEKVRKIKPINSVLIENNIKTENVIGSVDLVSIDDKLEYLLKVREKRMLFGFIPFGHREKYISLNASQEIEITE